ncbi:helix-turn-helix transcriptional regulator [Clostridium sp. D33t1_170424_F3]|uniref:helix-turn-helix domain-containing protein n=1 Tax=Clostridium sp. D33t1_170424_F3 TaxID=2787099 RepID=UPI0018A90CC6|nr:helix-turn-helix transcriptional regulator [Clostridium sp. D33t1_170424_F3]
MQKFLQDTSIGGNLQKIRKSRNLSQKDMVDQLQLLGRGMTRANYAHIEQGIRNIYISDLILFRKILNVSYDEFFEGIDPIHGD